MVARGTQIFTTRRTRTAKEPKTSYYRKSHKQRRLSRSKLTNTRKAITSFPKPDLASQSSEEYLHTLQELYTSAQWASLFEEVQKARRLVLIFSPNSCYQDDLAHTWAILKCSSKRSGNLTSLRYYQAVPVCSGVADK